LACWDGDTFRNSFLKLRLCAARAGCLPFLRPFFQVRQNLQGEDGVLAAGQVTAVKVQRQDERRW